MTNGLTGYILDIQAAKSILPETRISCSSKERRAMGIDVGPLDTMDLIIIDVKKEKIAKEIEKIKTILEKHYPKSSIGSKIGAIGILEKVKNPIDVTLFKQYI